MYSVYVALHTGCGFIYRCCDGISTVVWWHKELIWCYIECIWCHTFSGYGVIQKWVWYQWRFCDDKDTVGAVSNTVGVMSCLKWMWHCVNPWLFHFNVWQNPPQIKKKKKKKNTVVWCDRVDVISSVVQMMSHICQVWYQPHTVLCFHT